MRRRGAPLSDEQPAATRGALPLIATRGGYKAVTRSGDARLREGAELLGDEQPRDARHLALEADHRRVRAVRRAEGVVHVHVAELRRRGRVRIRVGIRIRVRVRIRIWISVGARVRLTLASEARKG